MNFFVSINLFIHTAPKLPGEDERTVAVRVDNGEYLISVTDGCGGAGGRRYPQADNWTGARLASHEAGRALQRWFLDPSRTESNTIQAEQQAAEIHAVLKGTFNRLAVPLKSSSLIIHNMGSTMPTTLSAVTAMVVGPRRIRLRYFWAGNSRGYLLYWDGLHQITRDDSVGQLDPFEDLQKDGVLNNVICANQDFAVNAWELTVSDPCIILSASDGVFSYFLSPVEFEGLLLQTMMEANTPSEWENALRREIGEIAGDDHTLQLAVLGFQTFQAIKTAYTSRWETWRERYGKKLEVCKEMEDPEAALAALWADYKTGYMRRK